MFSRLYSGFRASPAPEPDEALEQLRQLLEGTEVEEQLRAFGESGIGPGKLGSYPAGPIAGTPIRVQHLD